MKNEIANSLLTIAPNAMRDLHALFGMDFRAPYGIEYIEGSYTINKIIKIATADGYNPGDLLVILTRDLSALWRNGLTIATVERGGKIEIDYKPPYRANRRGLDTFYTKKDFDTVRKCKNVDAYILWQCREYLKKPKEKQLDKAARYNLKRVDYSYASRTDQKYPSKMVLEKMDGNGTHEYYRISHTYTRDTVIPATVDDVIDKSGYLVYERREDLKRRAASLRAQREKERFDSSDNTAKVENLAGKIAERKAEIMHELAEANTVEELTAVSETLSRWRGLAGIVYYTEQFKTKVNSKRFKSISECESEYNYIMSMFDRKI